MHAVAVIAHVIALHSSQAPVVLDGCGAASAIRAAAIAEMAPADDDTLAAVADLLLAPDGATCLMESWTLVALARAHADSAIVTRTLAVGLAAPAPHVAARAARLVRVLGVGDAAAFARVVARPEMTPAAFDVLRDALADMPAGPRKASLAGAVDRGARTVATGAER